MRKILQLKVGAIATISAIALVAILSGATPVQAQYFTIDRYHADIEVNEDGSFVVEERIEVTFSRARHGIYREIPYKYVNELGDKIKTPTTVLSVKKPSGQDWTYRVRTEGDVVNIRIGHPDVYVDGRQVYVITYRVQNGLMYFEDHDELYWNVTGTYWKAPIQSASATITLPSGAQSQRHDVACYTGSAGSSESHCEAQGGPDRASFSTRRNLRTGEGFTVAFGWDKGIVAQPTAWQQFLWKTNLRQNWVFAIPLLVLLFMLVHWWRKGRDPKVRESVAVMYKPPEQDGQSLSPAEVGTLVDESMDSRDVTSSIVGLAVKGYVDIEEVQKEGLSSLLDSTDYVLHQKREPDSELTPFEYKLMGEIFAGGVKETAISDMKNKFYRKLPGLRKVLFKQLVDKKFFPVAPDKIKGRYGLIGFAIIFIGGFVTLFATDAPIQTVISTIGSGVIVLLFSNAMPAKTRTGALRRMEVLGFQEFMNRADKDRLERLGKDVFYKYLPYAMALDVVDHWSAAFKDIFKEPPDWYRSRHGFRTFSTHTFASSLTAASSHLGKAMFSAPRGSGSSGGGSVGGGGGGGGGGSW